MTATQPPPEGHNALVAFAALLGLLARHPELSALPVRWSYGHDGITLTIAYDDPNAQAVAEQFAQALGGTISHSLGTFEHASKPHRSVYVEADLAGIPVFGAGTVLAEDGGGS
jgi:hypothetical protein